LRNPTQGGSGRASNWGGAEPLRGSVVVENIIKPEWVWREPLYAAFLGFCLSMIGTSVGLFVFTEDASLAGVLFTTIAGVAFLNKIIIAVPGNSFWDRNQKLILIYGLFFFGVTLSYIFWYLILPPAASQFFFSKQIAVLSQPFATFSGFFSFPQATFLTIVANNLKIVMFVLILSLIYGSGAVMIITWNASVLGIFIASFGKFTTFLAFVPHTSLEFLAFFCAAVAGTLMAISFDRAKVGTADWDRTISDASILFILAVIFIVLGAMIETGLIAG